MYIKNIFKQISENKSVREHRAQLKAITSLNLRRNSKFNLMAIYGAIKTLENYGFPGNIRQLRNIAEQISVIEENRVISANIIMQYLPNKGTNLPSVISDKKATSDFATEREIMYKILFC